MSTADPTPKTLPPRCHRSLSPLTHRSTKSSRRPLQTAAIALAMLIGSLGLATTSVAQTETDSADTNCPSATGTLPFADVDPDSFAYEDLRCLLELEIITSTNRYRPKAELTREEMASFMARLYAAVTGSEAPVVTTNFTDLPEDSVAKDNIARIYGLGITRGTTSTTYSPSAAVLRSHMALFLARLYKVVNGSEAPVVATNFTDIARRTPEQRRAIAQIFGLGVTTGTTPTTFAPRAGVTREQIASFVARLYRTLTSTTAKAPNDVAATPTGDNGTELTITWTAPTAPSGGTAASYAVQWKSGEEDYAPTRQQASRTTTTIIGGLSKGTEYAIRVAATDASGNGPWSTEVTGIPAVVPGRVSNFQVAPGNKELILTWEPPADNGGSKITGYLVRWASDREADPDEFMIDDPTTQTYTITSLQNTSADNPVAYDVWVAAVNDAGRGILTRTPKGRRVSPTTVAAGLPSALAVRVSPTSGTELIVEWQAPLDDGGEAVTSYRVERKCATGGRGGVGGGGSLGTTSGWVTTGIPGNPAGRVDVPDPAPEDYSITIGGLDKGQPCEIRVRAVNSKTSVNGPWEWASVSAAPLQAPGPPILNPSDVVSAHQALQLFWTPPTDTGGSTISGYEITYVSDRISRKVSVDAAANSATITDLNNGTAYTVSIRAVSDAGQSQPSAAVAQTPKPVPAAPLNFKAGPAFDDTTVTTGVVVDPESLTVAWNPPQPNGTNPVLGYIVEYRESLVPPSSPGANDGKRAGDWTNVVLSATDIALQYVILSELKDRRSGSTSGRGVSFDVRVRATNDHDDDPRTPPEGGPWAMTSYTPATQPGSFGADQVQTAANIDVEAGFRSLTVTWNPPDDGGSAITHYLLNYSVGEDGELQGDIKVNAPANRYTITSLRTDTTYSVTIRAANAVGTGESSQRITGLTSARPPAPTGVTATVPKVNADGAPGNGTELTVTWRQVTETNGATPITGYEVQYRRLADPDKPVPDVRYPAHVWKTVDGDSETTGTNFPLGALTAQIQGLEEGASYEVRVRAVTRSGVVGVFGYAPVVTTAGIPRNVSIFAVRINDAPSSEPASTKIISWQVSGSGLAGVTNYRVRWFPSEAGADGSIGAAIVDVGTETHTVTDLRSGTYVARVSACNAIGCTREVPSSYDTSSQSGDRVTVP